MSILSTRRMSRRSFLGTGIAAAGMAVQKTTAHAAPSPSKPQGETQPWPPEGVFPSYLDDKTGVRLYSLTPGGHASAIVYQTHPMWTRNQEHLVFHSNRDASGNRLWMVELKSGEMRPVPTESYETGTMTWKNNDLYYVADKTLHVLDLVKAFHGEGTPKPLGRIPDACLRIDGTVTVDADLSAFYFGGVIREDKVWGVFAIDLKSGEARTLAETDFRVGHFQANPFTPGSLMFCQETGGDADQRIWHLHTDHPEPAPLYKETYGEWVTHEVWWDPERIIFTIWPYDDEHKGLPHGVATADIHSGPEGKMELLTQYPAWHTHGSPDGNWALGDDFDRNLWLINVKTKERKLLTQGHTSGDHNTHPHGSFTPDNRGLVFNSSRNGVPEILYAPLPDWKMLA